MLLRAYLDLNGVSIPAFADAIGVSVQTVHRYLNNERIPRPEVMVRIKKATSGAVRPNDFYPICCEIEAA